MLFNFQILSKKPFFSGSFTRKLLSKSVVKFKKNPALNTDYTFHRVNELEEMRPDIISEFYYGTENYADILCKYNGISNPFSLIQNDIIRIPKDPTGLIVESEDIIDKGTIKAIPNIIKPNRPDENRLKYLKSLGTSVAPPNLTLPSDKNIKVENGKIIFGGDVTKVNKQDCPTPISRSNVLKNLIESKIFK